MLRPMKASLNTIGFEKTFDHQETFSIFFPKLLFKFHRCNGFGVISAALTPSMMRRRESNQSSKARLAVDLFEQKINHDGA